MLVCGFSLVRADADFLRFNLRRTLGYISFSITCQKFQLGSGTNQPAIFFLPNSPHFAAVKKTYRYFCITHNLKVTYTVTL